MIIDGTNGLIQQYDYQAPTTGFSYTFAAGTTTLVMNPAGTLATGTITMPAAPADGMSITFSSSQTITALTVNGNTGQSIVRAPKLFGAGSAVAYVYRLANTTWYPMTNYAAAGSVLQVVSTTKTDSFSATTTVMTDVTGLSVSITPTSSSSKIFIMLSMSIAGQNANGGVVYKLVRGSTDIGVGDVAGSRLRASGAIAYIADPNSQTTVAGSFLDSPATTSSTTYKVQVNAYNSGGAVYINQSQNNTDGAQPYNSRTTSTITVMEIAT